MSKHKNPKRHLDLHGLKNGAYGVVASMKIEPSGYPVTLEAFRHAVNQCVIDLKNSCPENVPVSYIVDFPVAIRIRAVVPASQQGSLHPQMVGGTGVQSIQESSVKEAEAIAAASRKISMAAIDHGNKLAQVAESRQISPADAAKILATSPDEKISRKTYGRARGPENQIDLIDGQRQVGGNRNIPATLLGETVFHLERCHLQEISPSKFRLEKDGGDKEWRKIQSELDGSTILQGQGDSPITVSLRYAEISRSPADLSVCIAEKMATKKRWMEPIKVSNSQEIFDRSREHISHLEDVIENSLNEGD